MPGGAKGAAISKARVAYKSNINIYPFHCYVSWPIEDNGNIFLHDGKFVPLLYRMNNDRFEDVAKVRDIRQNEKNSLGEFMGVHNRIALLVDCENSDPYKLCAALRNIQNYRPEDIGRIQKIVLYDDVHTVDTWKILGDYVGIPIEYELIERVNNFKSLVDIRMTAGACKEHYQDDIDAFLLASSDSDYRGLISSLTSADFLVLAEDEKCGDSLRGALERAGIFYLFSGRFRRQRLGHKSRCPEKRDEEAPGKQPPPECQRDGRGTLHEDSRQHDAGGEEELLREIRKDAKTGHCERR